MRDVINKYAYPIAGVVLVFALLFAAFQCRGKSHAPEVAKYFKAFFIDEETGEESVRSVNDYPPLMGKSGKRTVVRAYKFTNDGGKTVVIGYLEKYSDEAIEVLTTSKNAGHKMNILNAGPLIRLPSANQEWVERNSPAGKELLDASFAAMRQSGGGKLEPVYPK